MIHIGYPKTASTYLQKVIFDNIEMGFISPWGPQAAIAMEEFVIVNPFVFNPDSARQKLMKNIEQAKKRELVTVLSNEGLACVGITQTENYIADIVANRIYQAFPDAKILIIIREQKSMIYSLYNEHIKGRGINTIEEFMGIGRKIGFNSIIQLEVFKYDFIIKHYQNLFGLENVLVLPFEYLKENPQEFVKKISEYAGIKTRNTDFSLSKKNQGLNGYTLVVKRILNHLSGEITHVENISELNYMKLSRRIIWKSSRLLDRIIPQSIHGIAESKFQKIISEQVKDMYKSSNKKTSELIGIELANLGYDC